MSLPRYPAYQDSKLEWAKTLPEHWLAKHLKRNVRLLTEKIDTRKCPVGLENLEGWTGRFIQTESDFQGEGVGFEVDDILFGKLRPYLAKAWLADRSGEAIGDFHVLRPFEGVIPRFIQYQLLTREVIDLVDGSTYGAKMPRASWGFLGCLELPTPPTEEQLAIASFLDRETAKTDALIAEQQRLIELLQEKRQAVISHAVTKGLNPDAPMKDSGVEWLGEVPEHWEIRAIKHLVSTPVTDGPHETPELVDEGVPFISAEAVSSGSLDFNRKRGFITKEEHERFSMKYIPAKYDIYMVKSGATTGVTAIVETDDEFNIWSPLAAIRCGNLVNPYYLLAFMRSRNFQSAVMLGWNFGTQQNIGMKVIENLAVAVPPIDEQRICLEHLETLLKPLQNQLELASTSINLLQERRSALISAAVTGQIDVRGLVTEQEVA